MVNITLYIEELKKDTIVNEINLKEKALSLPAIKAKWVARIINHKNNLNILEKRKKNIIRDALPRVKESLPVKLSDNFIKEKAEETTEVISVVKDIDEEKMIIDFLERTEKIISSMSYDMSNIIKIVQLETL